MTDGNTISVHNIEIGGKWLYYTKKQESEAPTLKIAVEKVFAYKIGEGELTVLSKAMDSPGQAMIEENTAVIIPQQLEAIPSDDNAALINSYNNHPGLKHNKKKGQADKYCDTFLSLWSIEDGSVLSDANVEIGFESVYAEILKKRRVVGNRIKITNKTNAPIYIDLASSFKILNGGYAQPYFSNPSYPEWQSAIWYRS